jgi:hypothetical protein
MAPISATNAQRILAIGLVASFAVMGASAGLASTKPVVVTSELMQLAQYAPYPPYPAKRPCNVAGGAFVGAARGATGGAIIGGIAGNAGRGAAVGAAIGGIAGASRRAAARDYGYCY